MIDEITERTIRDRRVIASLLFAALVMAGVFLFIR